ncbi:MAG TPA: tetratricopeptide repeat protein [Terriglobales bacterium]|nr:tetratricopeptide repeat protein [Terriglobales bacterium]
MKPGRRTTAVLTAVLLLCATGAMLALGPLDRLRSESAQQEALYIPSPTVLKGLSLGYNGLLADIYWTRAVQYFGAKHHEGDTGYKLLYPLLDITTRLDPHLLVAYQFGSIFLCQRPPQGAGQPEKAIELIERGIAANPSDWKLYYNLGFIYYDAGAFDEASKAFARGAAVPGSHPALATLAGAMAKKEANTNETARLLWTKLYESSENRALRENALQHLVALKIQEEIPFLEQTVATFHDRTGRYPTNFEEMVAAGWLKGIPQDPIGRPYMLLPEGRVEAQADDWKRFIRFGLTEVPPASNSAEQNPKPQASATATEAKPDTPASSAKNGQRPHRRRHR